VLRETINVGRLRESKISKARTPWTLIGSCCTDATGSVAGFAVTVVPL
jgi:hypothetical protein